MAALPGSFLTNPLFRVLEFALGLAIGPALRPEIQDIINEAWRLHPERRLAPMDAATLLARSIPVGFDLAGEAAQTGIDGQRFDALTQLARHYPELPLGLELWRRNEASAADVRGWLHRAGYSDEIATQLMALKSERLSPQEVALGIMRSIIADPNLMPVQLNTAGGVVKAYPQSNIDALTEALDSGIDRERLRVMVGEIGLPMSAQQAASALFRGIIERPDYNRSIVEGDTRPEWAAAILEQAREILTVTQAAELELRGYLTAPERRAQTAKHGMSDTDSDHLYDVLGRSIPVKQVLTGEARGGVYNGPSGNIPQAYLRSLQRGNLRPEYYSLAYANRYTYPSFFAIRALMQGGALTADQGYELLLEMGWKPSLAREVADFYGQATTVKVDPLVRSARTTALTRVRDVYVQQRADDAQAQGWLTALNVDPTVQTDLLDVWRVMRTIPGAGLTRAQVKKAFKNLPTEWDRTRALDELEALGMEPDEAQTFLDE